MKVTLSVTQNRRRRPIAAARLTAVPAVVRRPLGTVCGLAILLLALTGRAGAQTVVTDGGGPAPTFMAPLSSPGLQPFWVGYVGADRGLGYRGQYFSFGGLMPITTDIFDGTWFFDGRGHITADDANFFSNIGIGRRVIFEPLNSIIGVSGWYDYDGNAYQNYGYRYNQLGVTAEVFNPLADFRLNAYFPLGQMSHVLDGFTQNYMLYVNGIDTALKGGDAKFSIRPPLLANWNGYIDIGGYAFSSPVVNTFGGVSTGFGVQPFPGVAVNMEINHDDTFGTTGFVRLAFGLRGSPGNSRTGERLLEPTRRNDHIVRFNQQPQIASNPETGAPYHVIHVDNSAPLGGNGTVEHPFRTLAAAQAASAVNDVIYVHSGNGTSQGYDTGINLLDHQQLLGSGNSYIMPSVEVGAFTLHAITASRPVLTNANGAAVTLANFDRVGGIATNNAVIGIAGAGITNTVLEQNLIQNSVLDGIQLTSFAGSASIRDNEVSGSFQDNIHIIGGNAYYDVHNNVVETAIRNGIFFDNAHGSALVTGNTLGTNGRGNWGGLHTLTTTGAFSIEAAHNTATGNTEGLIFETNGAGALQNAVIHDNISTYNQGDGFQLAARNGSTLNVLMVNNESSSNGYRMGVGAGIRVYTLDSTFNWDLINNALIANAGDSDAAVIDQGAGIAGVFDGDSLTNILMRGNTFDGHGTYVGNNVPVGDNVRLEYRITDNTVTQFLTADGNTVVHGKGTGFAIINEDQGNLYATFVNNTIMNNFDAGIAAFQESFGGMRLVVVNNTITYNVSPNAPDIGSAGVDSGLSLSSGEGNMYATISNNILSHNGQISPTTVSTNVAGIFGRTSGFGTMGLEIFGNQINSNGNRGIEFQALDGYNNLLLPPFAQTVTLGAEIYDNMIQNNAGTDALFALTPQQSPPRGPNLSFIAIDLTHNEGSKQYTFRNEQQPPDTAQIGFADGGLNGGVFNPQGNTSTLGTVFQDTVANIDALIAPLLTFP